MDYILDILKGIGIFVAWLIGLSLWGLLNSYLRNNQKFPW